MEKTSEAHSPEPIEAGADLMLDGANYVESVRDAREVHLYGERVQDITRHEAPHH